MVQFTYNGTVKQSFIYTEPFFGSIYIVIYILKHSWDVYTCIYHSIDTPLEVFKMNVIL